MVVKPWWLVVDHLKLNMDVLDTYMLILVNKVFPALQDAQYIELISIGIPLEGGLNTVVILSS